MMLVARFWDAGTGLSDYVVRFVSRRVEGDPTNAVHVSLEAIWQDEAGAWRWEGVEAVPTGVRRYAPSERVPLDATRAYILPTISGFPSGAADGTLELDPEIAWSYADGKVGVPYDFAGLLVALACACTHRPRSTFFDSRHASLFCSELGTNALRAGGYDPFDDRRHADNVTPASLEEALIAKGWTRLACLEFRTTEKHAA